MKTIWHTVWYGGMLIVLGKNAAMKQMLEKAKAQEKK